MGMYTELILGCSLKKDTPKDVIDKIKSMIDGSYNEGRNVFLPHSCYFAVSESKPFFKKCEYTNEWILSTRGNIKNYLSEIEDFLTWIKPYISCGSGSRDMYAIVIYEESDSPDIYYLN